MTLPPSPSEVKEFLAGDDVKLDEELVPYEILCSEAHTVICLLYTSDAADE